MLVGFFFDFIHGINEGSVIVWHLFVVGIVDVVGIEKKIEMGAGAEGQGLFKGR